ncbi:MAG: DUF5916 domain-containing protein [Acidobacteriota bacterium]
MRSSRFLLLLLIFFLDPIIVTVYADTPLPERNKTVRIVRIQQPPRIDGVLSSLEWDEAVRLTDSYQISPGNNVPAPEKTTIFLAYDDENFYIAYDCRSNTPDKIRATLARRDQVTDDDFVTLYLDTFNDQRRAYLFRFNPMGVQSDGFFTEEKGEDRTVDVLHTSKGSVDLGGYVVEVAIPFRSLRYKPGTWGFVTRRKHAAKDEVDSWLPFDRNSNSFLAQEGIIEGLEGVNNRRTLEVIPTITISETGRRQPDGRLVNLPVSQDMGVSIKYGLTPNITLGLAINPDFSQVEADFPQIDVNTRFPLFFPEKRPFFLEGADIFQTSSFNLLQTRQIVAPIVAAKLTGKMGKNTFGLITALDEQTSSLRFSSTRDEFFSNALFSVFRFKRDVRSGSSLGFMVTDREFNGSFNRAASIDGRLRLSEHYITSFQYAETVTKDLDGTKESGRAIKFNLDYITKPLGYNFFVQDITPNYRVDSGFTTRTDIREIGGYLRYTYFNEMSESVIRRIQPMLQVNAIYNHKGQLTDRAITPTLETNFNGNHFASLFLSYERTRFADINFDTKYAGFYTGSSYFKWVNGNFYFRYGEAVNFDLNNAMVGKSLNYTANLNFNLRDKLRIELNLLRDRLSSKAGKELFDVTIYRTKINQQFTRNTSMRFIMEYNTFRRRANGSLLFGYTPNPGTAIYLGYNDLLEVGDNRSTIEREMGFRRQQRSLFLKLSYLIRR